MWLSEPAPHSPPSPSTIGSTTDSQTGGYFPPPSDTSSSADEFTRGRSVSQPQPRRHNLSLSIPAFPPPTHSSQISPSSLASSGALCTTDSFSMPNQYLGSDYFYLDDASFPSSALDQHQQLPSQQPPSTIQPHTIQPTIFRQPASQPSSPVRGVFPPGQGAFLAAGRARGATFSGASPNFDFSSYQQQLQQPIASAVPHHLAFNAIPSPTASPVSALPLVSTTSAHHTISRTLTPLEDVTTPLAAQRLPVPSASDQEMSMEMVDKLTLLERCVEC